MVIWIYGRPGAGKTTLAKAIAQLRPVFILDGDEMRRGLCMDLGFSDQDRTENIRRIAEVARCLSQQGAWVVVAAITPLIEHRKMVSEILANRVVIVQTVCSSVECERRDPKGLYKQARLGQIQDMTGVTSPFEEDDVYTHVEADTFSGVPEIEAQAILELIDKWLEEEN